MTETRARVAHARAPDFAIEAVDWRTMADDTVAWDALALCAAEPNPFFESWYLLPSLRAFDADSSIRLLRFEVGGELAGLMPIARNRRYYRHPIPNLSNWLHDNAFLGAPLVAAGLEREFWRTLLTWADGHAGLGLFLHLAQIPLDGPLKSALDIVLAEQARTSGEVHREDRALLDSFESPETYFEAALSGKKRKELRRQFSRLSELGDVSFERRDDIEGLEDWIHAFLALEKAGWKGLAGSALASDRRTATLFAQGLRGAGARGRLERLTLALDGKPIAMLATFLTPPGAYSFKTAFDEDFARFSPGVLLQRENLAILNRAGIDWTDSCAAADHPMIDHLWRERRAIGHLSIAIGGKLRRAAFARLLAIELGRKSVERT
ncbi:MAG TPA: GNAT family N-acetyltransferase [Novosphingobium sp.]